MTHPAADVSELARKRRRYGPQSRGYTDALAALAETVEAVGIERFLDDWAGSAEQKGHSPREATEPG